MQIDYSSDGNDNEEHYGNAVGNENEVEKQNGFRNDILENKTKHNANEVNNELEVEVINRLGGDGNGFEKEIEIRSACPHENKSPVDSENVVLGNYPEAIGGSAVGIENEI
eukprot:Awhi_evm1s6470